MCTHTRRKVITGLVLSDLHTLGQKMSLRCPVYVRHSAEHCKENKAHFLPSRTYCLIGEIHISLCSTLCSEIRVMLEIGTRTCQLGAGSRIVRDVYHPLSSWQTPIHSSRTQIKHLLLWMLSSLSKTELAFPLWGSHKILNKGKVGVTDTK